MPELWMPEAEHYDLGDHAPTDHSYPPRAIAHITWDKNGEHPHVPFEQLLSYFTHDGRQVAPHILWDPFTGQFAQFFPADSRSKSVVDLSGGTRTNRAGAVVLQIEACFFPGTQWQGTTYQRLDHTPCKGWDALHAWVHGWGVPDVWPMGHPEDFTAERDEHTWETRGGWYGHAQVPENEHTDPGSWPAFPSEVKPSQPTSGPTSVAAHPFPAGLRPNSSSPSARPLQRALKLTHWMDPGVVEADNYGPITQHAVAGFNAKHHLNDTGKSYDPAIGPRGWALLMHLAYGS